MAGYMPSMYKTLSSVLVLHGSPSLVPLCTTKYDVVPIFFKKSFIAV